MGVTVIRQTLSMRKARYADHQETLTALITHLALTTKKRRTPTALANYLLLDRGEVLATLDGFPGFFRKSPDKSPMEDREDDHFYSLHLRFVVEDAGGSRELESGPVLGAEYLKDLLDLVTTRAAYEVEARSMKVQGRVALMAAFVAALSAIASAYIAASAA